MLQASYERGTDEMAHNGYSCSCTATIHIPTADEIAKGFGASMQQQIQQGIEDGVKKALVEIEGPCEARGRPLQTPRRAGEGAGHEQAPATRPRR
jgi:hypothetical protein